MQRFCQRTFQLGDIIENHRNDKSCIFNQPNNKLYPIIYKYLVCLLITVARLLTITTKNAIQYENYLMTNQSERDFKFHLSNVWDDKRVFYSLSKRKRFFRKHCGDKTKCLWFLSTVLKVLKMTDGISPLNWIPSNILSIHMTLF